MKDLIGKACYDFYHKRSKQKIYTETSRSLKEEMPVYHWFRTYEEMPEIEKFALENTYGKVLDVGCGVGSHSLYLQEKNIFPDAIDISSYVVEIAKERGVKNVSCKSLLDVKNTQYDTILMLMNGTGIFQSIQNIDEYLQHIATILTPKGQLLIDSSDIIYLYETNEKGKPITKSNTYYGEVDFTIYYKGEEEKFPWLYLDFETFQKICLANKLFCEMFFEGKHFDYLARITRL